MHYHLLSLMTTHPHPDDALIARLRLARERLEEVFCLVSEGEPSTMRRLQCTWTLTYSPYEDSFYETECGTAYVPHVGAPTEDDWNYCAKCGGRIVVRKEDG